MSVYGRVATACSVNHSTPRTMPSVITNYVQSLPSAPKPPSAPSETIASTSMSSNSAAAGTVSAPRHASPYIYSETNHLHIIEITTCTYLPHRQREEKRHVVRIPLVRDRHANQSKEEAVGRWMLEERYARDARDAKENEAAVGDDDGLVMDTTSMGMFVRRPSGRGLEDCRRRAAAAATSRRTVVVVGGHGL